MKQALVVAAITVLSVCAPPPAASGVLYTFSGAGGLSGAFTLDDTTPFVISVDAFGTSGVLASPLSHISGVLGAFTFAGTPSLFVTDLFSECCGGAEDSWIIRSNISGPSVNGLTPAALNLFIFRNANSMTPISLIPPQPGSLASDFQYTFSFTDHSLTSGALTTLRVVPEQSTLASLVVGVVLTVAINSRRRRRPQSPRASRRFFSRAL